MALFRESPRGRLRGLLELLIIFYVDFGYDLANRASRQAAKARRRVGVIEVRLNILRRGAVA
jgi:hypothetical protein